MTVAKTHQSGNRRPNDGETARSITRMLADVRVLSDLGEKLPGSPAERAACDLIAARLQEFGISHEVHRFEAFIGWPIRSEVLFSRSHRPSVQAAGIAFGASTGAKGIAGQVADCCDGDFAGRVPGKFALIDGMPTYAICLEAQVAGAIGVIAMSSGHQKHSFLSSPIFGAPTSDSDLEHLLSIPAVQVSRPDGESLREELAPVTLVAETRREWRQVCMPIATIPGREPYFLLLGGHYCTWHQGATDNAAGVALLIELARHFRTGPVPRYGIKLGWWTGHEQGCYAGSSWFADYNWLELNEKAIAYLNVDIVGVRGATTKAIRNTSAELTTYVEGVVSKASAPIAIEEQRFLQGVIRRPDHFIDYRRPNHHSDQSFFGAGLSSLQVSALLPAANEDHLPQSGLAWWWQTEFDTPDKCDATVLATDMHIHTALVDGIVNCTTLPFDLLPAAHDIRASLTEYARHAPELTDLGPIIQMASSLELMCERLRHQDISKVLNVDALLLRVTRWLNPIMFAADNEFKQDLGHMKRLLPGLEPALALSKLGPEQKLMALVGLRRQCNRIARSLLAAVSTIEDILSRITDDPA